MIRKLFISFLCVASLGFAANAQAPEDGGVMTLHDCMAYAVSNSTKMRIQQAAIGDAQIDRRDAALKLFTPQITAQTYAYYNFGRSIDPQTNTYFNTTSFHNNYGVSAGYELLEKIQLARVEGTIAKFFEKMADLDLLIIDDYGMKILDGQQLLDFMELIEDRHGRKSTIISSQLPVGSWYEVLAKNATIADAILDRMVNTSHIFELKGDSLRK